MSDRTVSPKRFLRQLSGATATAAAYQKAAADGTLHMLGAKPSKARRAAQPERELQRAIAKYLDGLPGCGTNFRWFHVPNERRDAREAKRLAGEGVKAGVPDIVIVLTAIADGPARVVFAEVKTPKGSLSVAQRDWREWCKWSCVQWFLVRSVDEVRAIMEDR